MHLQAQFFAALRILIVRGIIAELQHRLDDGNIEIIVKPFFDDVRWDGPARCDLIEGIADDVA